MYKNIIIIFIFFLFLSACIPDQSISQESYIVFDAIGREVKLPQYPEKIVVAGRQTPMLLNFLYLFNSSSQKIMAVEKRSQSVDSFLALIDTGFESKIFLERDAGVEQIAPLKPDVVILKSSMRESIGKQMEKVGLPVIYVDFESVDQIFRDLEIFASILNEAERGKELVNYYKQLKISIHESLKLDSSVNQSTVLMLQAEDRDGQISFGVPSAVWLQTHMVEELGGIAVWKEAAQAGGWTSVNIEQIINWNPDLIIIINYQGDALSIVNTLSTNPLMQNLEAVKQNKIYAFPFDFISWDQPDPRWILGYSWLASRIYPNQYSLEDSYRMARTFYMDFYTMTESDYQKNIENKISEYFEYE